MADDAPIDADALVAQQRIEEMRTLIAQVSAAIEIMTDLRARMEQILERAYAAADRGDRDLGLEDEGA
jgi:hypothetical protein